MRIPLGGRRLGQAKSRYHQIASNNQIRSDHLLRLMLEVGLISRAEKLFRELSRNRVRASIELRFHIMRTDYEAANALVEKIRNRKIWWAGEEERVRFCQTLLPFDPVCALEISERHARRASFLPAVGWLAKQQVHPTLLLEKFVPPTADYYLLKANVGGFGNDKIRGLNEYFSFFRLDPVRLVDKTRSLGVANIHCSDCSRSVHSGALVSVVMTTFNCSAFVENAIASIEEQTYQNFELIIVDDCSTDGTWERVQDIARQSSHIRAFRMRSNVGTYIAKNHGLRIARGNYVAFQDADDWSHPKRLEICINAIEKTAGAVAASCEYLRITEDGEFVSPKIWPITQWTPNSVVFLREKVMEAVGYFDPVRFGADSDYVERIKAYFGDGAHVRLRLPMIVASHRENSLMTSSTTGLNIFGHSSARGEYRQYSAERILSFVTAGKNLFVPAPHID